MIRIKELKIKVKNINFFSFFNRKNSHNFNGNVTFINNNHIPEKKLADLETIISEKSINIFIDQIKSMQNQGPENIQNHMNIIKNAIVKKIENISDSSSQFNLNSTKEDVIKSFNRFNETKDEKEFINDFVFIRTTINSLIRHPSIHRMECGTRDERGREF